jgi:hypothetical protein
MLIQSQTSGLKNRINECVLKQGQGSESKMYQDIKVGKASQKVT